MKKNTKWLLYALCSVLCVVLFASCEQATINIPDTTAPEKETTSPQVTLDGYAIQTTDGIRYVKNSDWDPVKLETLAVKTAARNAVITEEELSSLVAKLNESETDMQYFLLKEDVPAEEAPLCNIYIVNEAYPTDGTEGWSILEQFLDYPRQDVKERRGAWLKEADFKGGILFIDKIPPKPEPVIDPRSDHEKYTIYILYEADDEIHYKEHCTETCSAPDFFVTSGWKNIQEYYRTRISTLMSSYHHVGGPQGLTYVITGYYYTPPSER